MKKLKICLYYNHYETLGHSTRVYAILKGLREHFKDSMDILILHSGKRQNLFPFSKLANIVDIPFSIGKKWFFIPSKIKFDSEYLLQFPQFKKLLTARIQCLKEAIRGFKPNIFITEFYPFGGEFWCAELPYILDFLKNNIQCKIISSVGDPGWVKDTYSLTEQFYDAIIFHSNPLEIKLYLDFIRKMQMNSQIFIDVLRNFSKKIFFSEYILYRDKKNLIYKSKIRKKIGAQKFERLITVSRGGGTVAPEIIEYSLLSAEELRDVFFLISAGPSSGDEELRRFKRLSRGLKNIKLVTYLYPLEDYINASDLSVNMTGYNTYVRLMWLRKQNVSICYNSHDQKFRAFLLEYFNLSRSIQYESVSFDLFKKSITELLHNTLRYNTLIEKVGFNGVENTVKLLQRFLRS